MKKIIPLLMLLQLLMSNVVVAGDFEWLHNLNVRAEADASGFNLRLATRFHIGDVEVTAVLNEVARPADAYMIFRLGELSHRPVDEVVKVYSTSKQKGWGRLAKDLGIKPGSAEFHALKAGHDLYSTSEQQGGKSKGKGKGNKHKKGKSKGKGKNK